MKWVIAQRHLFSLWVVHPRDDYSVSVPEEISGVLTRVSSLMIRTISLAINLRKLGFKLAEMTI